MSLIRLTIWRSAAKAAPNQRPDRTTGREEPRRSRGVATLDRRPEDPVRPSSAATPCSAAGHGHLLTEASIEHAGRANRGGCSGAEAREQEAWIGAPVSRIIDGLLS